jgi:hypothetical protein
MNAGPVAPEAPSPRIPTRRPPHRMGAMPDRDASCPLCAAANECAMAANRAVPTCWCIRTPIPPAVLARVPATKVNSACVCQHCATAPPS